MKRAISIGILGLVIAMLLSSTALVTENAEAQTTGLEFSFGAIGVTAGNDTQLSFPEMNSTTFGNYTSTNAIVINNNGSTEWKYWLIHLNNIVGANYSYSMVERYSIMVYNETGALNQTIKADENADCILNLTVDANEIMYFKVKLHPEKAFAVDEYIVSYTISAYDSAPANTRSIASDTDSGTTSMTVTNTVSLDLSYTGTHPNSVYFTDMVGQSTVPSSNNLRITNTGNVEIDKVTIDVNSNYWKDSTDTDTSYAMNGNTKAKKITETSFSTLNPSWYWTFTGFASSTFKDLDLQLVNSDLNAGTYTGIASILAENTGLGLSKYLDADLVFQPYTGTLQTTLTFSSGTGLTLPQSAAGETNIQSTNSGIVTNSATSDYAVTTMEFLFAPLSDGQGHKIFFGDNADLTITDSGSNQFVFSLVSFTSNSINYGRALITLSDSDASKPNDLDPNGEQLSFKVKLYEIPGTTPAGSYSGTFTVTSSANPITRMVADMAFYTTDAIYTHPEYFVINPEISDGNDEYFVAGEQLNFNFTLSYGYNTYDDFLWMVFYEDDSTPAWIYKWSNVDLKKTKETYGYSAYPQEDAPTHTFQRTGNYTAYVAPINSRNEVLYDYMQSESFTVHDEMITTSSMSPAMTAGICGAIALVLVIIVIIYLMTRNGKKPR